MKKWKQLIGASLVFAGMMAAFVSVEPASAINVFDQCGSNPDAAVCQSTGDDVTNMTQTIISILLFVLGMVSVVIIVIGGIRYATSNGNATQIKEAKDTVLYAVIGLIVAILAYAIVNFVLSWF